MAIKIRSEDECGSMSNSFLHVHSPSGSSGTRRVSGKHTPRISIAPLGRTPTQENVVTQDLDFIPLQKNAGYEER